MLPSQHVLFECKNCSNDPDNPEFDQPTAIFSEIRGQLGVLVGRTIQNKELIAE